MSGRAVGDDARRRSSPVLPPSIPSVANTGREQHSVQNGCGDSHRSDQLTPAPCPAHGTAVRIGELADVVGVSPDTIRFYEREGLLPRPPRQHNGYREYGTVELARIRLML